MKIINTFRALFLLALLASGRAEDAGGGWSAELLEKILRAEVPPAEAAGGVPTSEMVLRTYQVRHLRVGEAGKPQNVISILKQLLPPGSSLNLDVPGNSVHVLTTSGAHQAVWEYLSAVDVADTPLPPAPGMPPEVQQALTRLAEAGEQSGRVLAAVGALGSDVSRRMAEIDARQRQQTVRIVGAAAALAAGLLGMLLWLMRRGRATAAERDAEASALAVRPEQLAVALTPMHEKMRGDMLGMLNEVAIKLQAQHGEQQKLVREQQQQIENARLALVAERTQFISEAGTLVVQAVERVDATTARLARQQDKVSELVQELQATVRELDQTKDSLRTREVELEQERAKIAALSILLEESSPPSGPLLISNGHRFATLSSNGRVPDDPPACPVRPLATEPSCTIQNPTSAPHPESRPTPAEKRPVLRCTFLPVDQPET